MDEPLVPRGLSRCSTGRFLLWLAPWFAIGALGAWAGWRVLALGLNQTNMDNRFAFGLWIFLDLAVIGLGAGAFFTGFLVYIVRRHELKAVIKSAVVIGFVCYSGALIALALDVGQPIRAWFTFWHPNVHSMLTEVTFCITCYLTVLAIEYVPILLRNRKLRRNDGASTFGFELHRVMFLFAALGTFLSFFHQGSLGGLFGVLRGRPFAFREGFAIWPSTFFLFVLSAAAVGPSFVAVTTALVSRITGRKIVGPEVMRSLAGISGRLLIVYVALKGIDTLLWINGTAPELGVHPFRFYSFQPFGTWILLSEIVLFGLLPAMMLLSKRAATSQAWLLGGTVLACLGVVLNRFVMTIQTLSLPTLAFEDFGAYLPSWQEIVVFGGIVAYGVIVYSLSYRWLDLFPQERSLHRA